MPRRVLNGLTPRLYTAVTDTNGVATFTIPAGRYTQYQGAVASVVSATSSGRYACQVASQPTLGTSLTATSGTVTVAVSISNSQTLTVLGATVLGMVAAGAGVTVNLLVWGV